MTQRNRNVKIYVDRIIPGAGTGTDTLHGTDWDFTGPPERQMLNVYSEKGGVRERIASYPPGTYTAVMYERAVVFSWVRDTVIPEAGS